MDNCNDCQMEDRIKALEDTVARNKDSASKAHKEFYERLRELEKNEAVKAEQYGTILDKLEDLTTTVSKVADSLSDIEAEPGKNWKDFKGKVVWAVAAAIITAVMAFLLKQVGL